MKRSYLSLVSALGVAGIMGGAVQAATVAHWTFENAVDADTGNVIAASDGLVLEGTNAPGPDGTAYMPDISGNDNRLYQFPQGGVFSSDVQYAMTPQTGVANNFSYKTNGADLFEQGDGNIRTAMNGAGQFTFEVSFKTSATNAWQGIIGHDRNPDDSGDQNKGNGDNDESLGTLWIGINGVNSKLHFYHWDTTPGGDLLNVTDPGQTGQPEIGVGPAIEADKWYSLAMVGDGSSVKLYLKSETDSTYQLIHTHGGLGLADSSATWTIGRGWFNGPNDFFQGNLDDVRISDEALAVDDLLGSPIPEPASAALMMFGISMIAKRR
ncbi:LamG-like jellyroll fold domain-containing protein [Poriferisphaera sp. WC338]|uniref:LamG-like jellyroll fold domain-containing protein n=1 Tax=Poriferisphaera sp. WC338 TaxID=3425129 RepID=UPI003D818673